MKYRVERAGRVFELEVELSASGYVVRGPDGSAASIAFELRPDGSRRAITPWGELELVSARRGTELWADVASERLHARVERVRPSAGRGNGPMLGDLHAPMAGKLLRVEARVGDQVRAGQPLAVIEAMKMENELVAPLDGVVIEIAIEAPSPIDKGALILKLAVS